jgi:hypothetical protein
MAMVIDESLAKEGRRKACLKTAALIIVKRRPCTWKRRTNPLKMNTRPTIHPFSTSRSHSDAFPNDSKPGPLGRGNIASTSFLHIAQLLRLRLILGRRCNLGLFQGQRARPAGIRIYREIEDCLDARGCEALANFRSEGREQARILYIEGLGSEAMASHQK